MTIPQTTLGIFSIRNASPPLKKEAAVERARGIYSTLLQHKLKTLTLLLITFLLIQCTSKEQDSSNNLPPEYPLHYGR